MTQLDSVVRFIRTLQSKEESLQAADETLLARFVAERDELAFGVLVQRHSPMVMAVCRRILGDHHQAEDATQATFLVFARKAASIKYRQTMASWLFGVATRTALKARSLCKCTYLGHLVGEALAAECRDELLWNDLRPVLDEEISRLPEKYRAPFVLCYLVGKTNAVAATELHCPLGTVITRLSRARARLRKRLSQRGITLSLAALGEALRQCEVSEAASTQTVRAMTALALKSGVGAGIAGLTKPMKSVSFVKGVLETMAVSKLKTAAILVTGVLALVGGNAGYQKLAASQGADQPGPEGVAQSGVGGSKNPDEATAPHYPPPPSRDPIQPPPPPEGYLVGNPKKNETSKPLSLTTFFTQVFEGGAIGQPIPFTIEIKGLPTEYAAQVLKQIPVPFQMKPAENLQAEKDFKTAEYYERTGHPHSAYFCYEIVCRRYPGTEYATKAAKKKEELLQNAIVEKALKGPNPALRP